MKNAIDNSNGMTSCSLGIDGCKGGWICAALEGAQISVRRFSNIAEIMDEYPNPNAALIDMPIGLQSSVEHVRPDSPARHMIRERASTIFPAPCRQAVYAESVAKQYDENERVLGKKFTPLTVGIIPKIREVDEYLKGHPRYRNFLMESHPEVCFAVLNGKTLLSKKNTSDGLRERICLLREYLPELSYDVILSLAKQLRCMADDIVDAVCLAVVGIFVTENQYDTVPSDPMPDETGLLMRIVFPRPHGKLHETDCNDSSNSERTSIMKYLIIIDMQNDFINGALGTAEAAAIVGKVAEKARAAEASGTKIIFTQDTHPANYLDTQEGRNLPVEHCIKGTEGWQLHQKALSVMRSCQIEIVETV